MAAGRLPSDPLPMGCHGKGARGGSDNQIPVGSKTAFMNINPLNNHRILLIDDSLFIHADFCRILSASSSLTGGLDEGAGSLYGAATVGIRLPIFEVDSAFQGEEGLDLIEKSLRENRPYALAFVDVRMPPGWDGIDTICKIWEKYPDLQVVLCTGFSHYAWEEMLKTLGYSHRTVILKKPFEDLEVLQLAIAMTEKWRLYQQAKLHIAELEKTVQDRTFSLESANGDLTAANLLLMAATEKAQRIADTAVAASDAKSGFLANMSHEIRTPMNGVIGMVDLLLDTNLTVGQRGFAKTIQSSAYALLLIINDILDFSKIEAGKMTFEKIDFDLRETVENTINLMTTVAHGKGLELSYCIKKDTATLLVGDPTRVRQILLNLLNNGIKFSEKGEVFLEILQVSEIEDNVELSFFVHDTGIGMSEEAQAKLFRSLMQAHASTTRKYGGTGLGLAICRKLVELMGGSIAAKSLLGKGSTFSFTLPFTKQKATVPEDASIESDELLRDTRTTPSSASSNGHRILLAEDAKTNQIVLIQVLQRLGYAVDVAQNGFEAVEAWRQHKYDIILMDCHMPEMDGYEATRKIRELEAQLNIKTTQIVAMTASAMPGDRELCFAAGMNDYTTKPVDQPALSAVLQKAKSHAARRP
jgi:two-component system, sensor histidine kinase and response regulator